MDLDFGQYRLLRLLGEGGMAQVWSARRQASGQSLRCAVKIIRPQHTHQAELRQMFLHEGRLSLGLPEHDNVVSVFDVGEHQDRPYLAMELVDGITLAELARAVAEPWPVEAAVSVVVDVLRALRHIHEQSGSPGIVHRDVTPHNVMVSRRGEVKLMDFGIACRADAEPSLDQALGTLSYVPREQVEGQPDPRSDLYAAGAVLFELLDGRRFRWHCADEDALFQEIYRDRVPTLQRRDVPGAVLAVLHGLLQPHREQRIASAAEALHRLEAWQGLQPGARALRRLYLRAVARSAGHVASPPSDSSPAGLLRMDEVADIPRARRWDELCPTTEHPCRPPWAEPSRPHRSPTRSHPRAAVDVASTDEIALCGDSAEKPAAEPPPDVPRPSHGLRPRSKPAWAARDGSGEQGTPEADAAVTRPIPAAQQDLRLGTDAMERLVTRRHPSAPVEADVPLARNSAEIAVTEPQPSRWAPWAEGAQPVERRATAPEPGAPVFRRRRRSTRSDDPFERTDSVSARPRESAGMHQVAGDTNLVTGEIVIDDGLDDAYLPPPWHMSSL